MFVGIPNIKSNLENDAVIENIERAWVTCISTF